MTYRDDREALLAQNEALQRQLEDAARELHDMRARAGESESSDPTHAPGAVLPHRTERSQPTFDDAPSARSALMLALMLSAIVGGFATWIRAVRNHAMYYGYSGSPCPAMSGRQFGSGRMHGGGLHERGFYEPIERTGRVIGSTGDSPVAAASECHVRVSPVSSPRFNCRVQVDCGGTMVYGSGHGGFARCTVGSAGPVAALDPWGSADEGDPKLKMDLDQDRIVVEDDLANSRYAVTIAVDRAP